MKLVLLTLGGASLLLTLISLSRRQTWWIRIGDFPRSQVFAAALLSLSLYLLLFGETLNTPETVFLAALGAAVVYQGWRMLPYTRLMPRQVQASRQSGPHPASVSFLIFNVLITNRQAAAVLALIERMQPDVVLLAEPDAWWAEKMTPLAQTYPYRVLHPLANAYGMLLYSRLELINPELHFLIEDDIPSVHTRMRLPSGDEIEFHGLHPRPPAPQENHRSTERDAELLLVAATLREAQFPVIVAGDLNDVAWSDTTRQFQRLSGLLDPRIGRGFYNTFHAHYPLIRFPLDHVFHSPHFRLARLRRLKDSCGSDHFPVFIRLSYEPDAEHAHEPPPAATSAEHAEARATVVEAIADNSGGPLHEHEVHDEIADRQEKIRVDE